jgi:hypothetical protein
MSMSSLAVRTTNLTITQACSEWRNGATGRVRTMEVGIVQAAATAQSLGFGVPAALGITPTSPVTLLRDDVGDPASLVTHALAWATSPTVPAAFKRRWNSAATIGVGVIWTFPRGMVMAISSAHVIWNITAAQASDINIAVSEE